MRSEPDASAKSLTRQARTRGRRFCLNAWARKYRRRGFDLSRRARETSVQNRHRLLSSNVGPNKRCLTDSPISIERPRLLTIPARIPRGTRR